MVDFLGRLSGVCFGAALLAGIILHPQLVLVWGVWLGIATFLFALGWGIAKDIKEER